MSTYQLLPSDEVKHMPIHETFSFDQEHLAKRIQELQNELQNLKQQQEILNQQQQQRLSEKKNDECCDFECLLCCLACTTLSKTAMIG